MDEHVFVLQRTWWPPEQIAQALDLAASGSSDAQISALTGIPAQTVRTYRRRPPRRVRHLLEGRDSCPRCGSAAHGLDNLDPPTYAYLLGVYLGDGWLGEHRNKFQLRIALDTAHPGVVDQVAAAIERIRGSRPGRVRPADGSNCVNLTSWWRAWPCLFPQHGPGRKHDRPIELEPWQRRHVDAAPEMFLRGLIHSDGCRTINRFKTKLPSGRVAEYEYPRYFFSNRSLDILGLFSDTCDLLGIRWTRSNPRNLSISHRASVARMDEFIGPKT